MKKTANPGFTLTEGTPVEIVLHNKVYRRGVVDHRGPNTITVRVNRSGRLIIFELDDDMNMWKIPFSDENGAILIRKNVTGFIIRKDLSPKKTRRS